MVLFNPWIYYLFFFIGVSTMYRANINNLSNCIVYSCIVRVPCTRSMNSFSFLSFLESEKYFSRNLVLKSTQLRRPIASSPEGTFSASYHSAVEYVSWNTANLFLSCSLHPKALKIVSIPQGHCFAFPGSDTLLKFSGSRSLNLSSGLSPAGLCSGGG